MEPNKPPYFLSLRHLQELAKENAHKYQNAEPFSHIIFDNFLPPEVLDRVLQEFPKPTGYEWNEYTGAMENKKLASKDYNKIPPYIRFVLDQLNTSPFVAFLEKLTGINGLIPDPDYDGGGMHQTKKGGHLGMHVDFNKHDKLDLYRRINVLLYLNKDWKDEYGGHLEIWDKDMKHCYNKVLPIFNRCVIFTTSEGSHHGHPDPLTCPEDRTRKSLAWYYYTSHKPENIDDTSHSTLFQPRPGKDTGYYRKNAKEIVKMFVPPIIISGIKKLLGRK